MDNLNYELLDPAARYHSPELFEETGRTGPPWEESGKLFSRFMNTVIGVVYRPSETFAGMRRIGKVGNALLFSLLAWLIALAILFTGVILFTDSWKEPPHDHGVAVMASIYGAFFLTVVGPFFIVYGLYISAMVTHLSLAAVGGAKLPFETTIRVWMYTTGALAFWILVPYLGKYLLLQILYVLPVGLSKAHEISLLRAFLAIGVCIAFGWIVSLGPWTAALMTD